MKKLLLLLLAIAASLVLAHAQSGELKGFVRDTVSQPIPFANIAVYHGPQLITGVVCNIDGEYSIKPLNIGTYTIEVSAVGYTKRQYTQVVINTEKVTFLNGLLEPGKIIACPLYDYFPSINISQGAQGVFWNAHDILRNPGR